MQSISKGALGRSVAVVLLMLWVVIYFKKRDCKCADDNGNLAYITNVEITKAGYDYILRGNCVLYEKKAKAKESEIVCVSELANNYHVPVDAQYLIRDKNGSLLENEKAKDLFQDQNANSTESKKIYRLTYDLDRKIIEVFEMPEKIK